MVRSPGLVLGLACRQPGPASVDERAEEARSTSGSRTSAVSAALVREISGRVERLAAADRCSGVVLVAHGDRVLLHVAHGQAERSFAAANRPDTRFNLGSMSKMFTSSAQVRAVMSSVQTQSAAQRL